MTTTTTGTAVKQAAEESQPKVLARPTPSRGKERLKVYGPPLVALALILVAWYVLAAYLVSIGRTTILPNPTDILLNSFFPSDPRDTPITGALLSSLGLSTAVALTGLAISIVIGVGWAVLMSQARWVERSLFPYAVMLQCIPILALVPLIGSSLGYSLSSRVLVCVLISLFPMVSNTLFGLQSADKSQRELFQLQGASRWTVLT
ncbi:MAG: ABC transporter permease subunit, partial [Propionibacteriaceae bacterium]